MVTRTSDHRAATNREHNGGVDPQAVRQVDPQAVPQAVRQVDPQAVPQAVRQVVDVEAATRPEDEPKTTFG